MTCEAIAERLRLLNSVPTAPFREEWAAAEALRQLRAMPGVEVEADAFGNLVARLRRGPAAQSTATFVAHLDHPGFLLPPAGVPAGSGRVVEAVFEGRVGDEYFPGAPVRLFRAADDPGIPGRVVEAAPVDPLEDNRQPVVIEASGPAEGAVLAMWDVEPFARRNGILSARVCDDLAGVSALLEMLDGFSAAADPVDVAVVLTRAEEAGFCGLLCLLEAPRLPELLPDDTVFISVEISAENASVRLGDGAVIRVGDRSSTFDGRVADSMAHFAAARGIRARRALMDGGTCEATAFARAGWRTGGVCAPVRNYHNQGADPRAIAPEQVASADLQGLHDLCRGLALACNAGVDSAPGPDDGSFARFLAKGRRHLAPPTPESTAADDPAAAFEPQSPPGDSR